MSLKSKKFRRVTNGCRERSGFCRSQIIEYQSSLLDANDKFKKIVESAPEPIFIQTEGKFAYLNPEACRFFSVSSPEELLGTPILDRIAEDYRELVAERIRTLNDARKPVDQIAEVLFLRKGGSTIWGETKGEPFIHEGKKGALVFVRDISRRKEAEEVVLRQEEFNRNVMDHLPIGISVNSVFPRVEFLYMNDRFPAYYGTTREALSNPDCFWDAVYKDPAYRDTIRKRVLEDIASGDPVRMVWEDVPILDEQANLRYVNACTIPVNGENFVISTVLDVTERKKHEIKINYMSNHDKLTDLFNRKYFEEMADEVDRKENLPITIVMADVNGLRLINDSLGRETGDELLMNAAEVMKDGFRGKDIIARVDGDQFAVILLNTDEAATDKILSEIKGRTSHLEPYSDLFSLSFGYAVKKSQDMTMRSTINEAEKRMYEHKIYESPTMRSKTIDVIMNILFEKSAREMRHSKRVSMICGDIAAELGLEQDEINQIMIAGLVHDIGKIGIAEEVLNKPAKLSEEEWKAVIEHPAAGWRILKSVDEFSDLALFILAHHERWDGRGYPKGLSEQEIPIQSRIISVADSFDAMTKDRPYRRGISVTDAVLELKKYSGSQFDPDVVTAFLKLLEKNNAYEI